MSARSFFKRSAIYTFVYSLLGISSITYASPASGATVDLSSWDSIGDVVKDFNQGTITNAYSDGSDDAGNYNVSGNHPTNVFSLENFLEFNGGSLGLDATEGSAFKTTLSVLAGDVFSFDYNFSTYDSLNTDRAFVSIGNSIFNLTGSSSFSHTFNTNGNYKVGIGIIDVNDTVGSSKVELHNLRVQPVPEPLTILGSVTALGFGVRMRRQFHKKLQHK